MASSVKLCSVLVLLSLLLLQIHARESSFFSKVPNNGVKEETEIPIEPLTKPGKKEQQQQQQEPNFIPQAQNSGYGLYGHESGQLPPSDAKFSDPAAGRPFTTTSTNYNYQNDDVSYKAESEEYYEEEDSNNNNDYSNDNFQNGNSKPYENSFYYNKDLYDNGRRNFGSTRLSRGDYTTTPLYEQEKNSYYNGGGGGGGVAERQGMSDTRFMENGKYFYDLDREPHHYRKPRGYFGNTNGNTYEYGNSMAGSRYQNGGAEFQEEPDQFVP
ncbi:protein E6-like [Momordica charantia]|uniref:Protein E6-like n=1 Tax=Momordica charantia TaxID=3673 RepID=A0A6J1CLM0_MOMCH|nr:protein E6-like [Momordica charantia]